MPWQQVTITTHPDAADTLSDWLSLLGAISITVLDAGDQAILEPAPGAIPLWDKVTLQALFPMQVVISDVHAFLQKEMGDIAYTVQTIEDTDWQEAVRAATQPLCFGNKLWVVPSWLSPTLPTDAIILTLDPGLAFGTGEHPTTALCLTWLVEHASKLTDKTVIDYGCGSGILAIAAVKCGAKQVFAVDYDPQALQATRDNAQRNHLSDQQVLTYLPEALPPIVADVIVANILVNPLCELAPSFAELQKPGMDVVLSGILLEQTTQLTTAYQAFYAVKAHTQQDSWLCWHGQRR